MTNITLPRLLVWLLAAGIFVSCNEQSSTETASEEPRERKGKDEAARFLAGRHQYEVMMLRDPATGQIPKGIFEKENAFAQTIPLKDGSRGGDIQLQNNYIPAGPYNIGGRTRAVAYDRRYNGVTNRVIIAGCVSGGIMRSTDGGATWTLVTPQNDIHNLTALAQDPRPGFQDTWYAGGGEFLGNSASIAGAPYLGYGVWKSVNNGASWTKLPLQITDINGGVFQPGILEQFEHPFDFTYRLAVNPTNGHLYVAAFRRLVRSINGGASFQAVFGNNQATNAAHASMDIAISNAGRILLGVNGGHPDPNLRGVWVSNTGDVNSFTRIAGGQNPGVDSVSGWRANNPAGNGSRRIVLTLAPSNQDIAYIFYENGLSSDPPQLQPEADLFRLDIAGNTYNWSNRSANMPDIPGGNLSGSDPLTVQGGYDMMVRVKPNDPNTVFIGGTNLYRSTDGFATNTNTAWIGGYQTNFTYRQYPNSHADIHEMDFNPANANEAICANDGGIQTSANISASTVQWSLPRSYQTLQYYYVSMDPDAGRNNFAGGSQDNGLHFRDRTGMLGTLPADSNDHFLFLGGDGGGVGISKLNVNNQTQYLYGSLQLGLVYRIPVVSGGLATNIRPNNLTPNPLYGAPNYGEFVTNLRLDPENTEDLYYVNFNRLFRTTSASSVSAGGWTELTGVGAAIGTGATAGANSIRAMAFSRGPYNTTRALFLGTTNGKIFRLDNPRNFDPAATPAEITPSGLIGNVQDIAVNPNNDNEIMAVVSNYGVTSGGILQNIVNIWWTDNAKSATPNWRQAEGNLAGTTNSGYISGRSCQIVVKKDAANNPVTEYYVGTGAGLFSVANLGATLQGGGTPTWQREGANQLNLAVIQHMAYRPGDNVLVIGTHGNGMYFSYLGSPNYTPSNGTAVNPVLNDRNFIKTLYPTLTTGTVQFQTGNMLGVRKISIEVFDMTGKTVYRSNAAYANGAISLQGLSKGAYILSITSEDRKNRFIQKLMKQ